MKELLSKEHYFYKIHIFLKENFDSPFLWFFNINKMGLHCGWTFP